MPRPNVSDQKKTLIINAFEQCLLEKSYDSISIKEIAQVANIPAGSIYYYFPAKEDIMAAHLNRYIEHYIQWTNGWLMEVDHEIHTLSELIESFLQYSIRTIDSSTTIYIRYLNMKTSNPIVQYNLTQSTNTLIDTFAFGISNTCCKFENPKQLARILIGLVDGLDLMDYIFDLKERKSSLKLICELLSANR